MKPTTQVLFKNLLTCLLLLLISNTAVSQAAEKARLVILTDISETTWEEGKYGEEPDDYQSLIRLLLYANEFDIEGLIANSSCWFAYNKVFPEQKPELIAEVVEAYGKVHKNLVVHADGYPSAEYLQSIIKVGNGHGMKAVGKDFSSEGSELLYAVLKKDDPRPVWVLIWGGGATLAQAIYDIRAKETKAETERLINKLRVYDIAGQDNAGAWICHNFKDIFYIRSSYQFAGIAPRVDTPLDSLVQERRGGNEYCISNSWIVENIQKGHGPLGKIYPFPRFCVEGDTPSLLYLIPNGLSNPENPHYGSWGGRFGKEMEYNVLNGSGELVDSLIPEKNYLDFKMYAEVSDSFAYEGIEYNNIYAPVFRWRTAFQNDFAARVDWSNQRQYNQANHPPIVNLSNKVSPNSLELKIRRGMSLYLDASASSDPDGDELYFSWMQYKDVENNSDAVVFSARHNPATYVYVPKDFKGNTIHIILSVKDAGIPNLTRYQRIILSIED